MGDADSQLRTSGRNKESQVDVDEVQVNCLLLYTCIEPALYDITISTYLLDLGLLWRPPS